MNQVKQLAEQLYLQSIAKDSLGNRKYQATYAIQEAQKFYEVWDSMNESPQTPETMGNKVEYINDFVGYALENKRYWVNDGEWEFVDLRPTWDEYPDQTPEDYMEFAYGINIADVHEVREYKP